MLNSLPQNMSLEHVSVKEEEHIIKHGSESSIESRSKRKGLSLTLASVFIVGEMAGSGVLALPEAIANAGWCGIAMLVICCINCLYAGICLGKCWTMLEERYEEYKEKNRYPYAAIAFVASGKKMRYLVSFCNDFTLFGVATVFLLLASQLIGSLAEKWGISFCYWVLILAVILCPIMWLGTPEDFWPAAILALVTTFVACILLFVALLKADNEPAKVEYAPPTVLSFFLAFGTILFAFGGASSFPTFQNDMRDKTQFPAAASIGFGLLLFIYLPVAVLGYVTYGTGVDKDKNPFLKSDIIQSLPNTYMKSAIEILLSFHLMFAFLLVINAPAQEFEEFFKVPKRFGWKRCLLRSGMMLLIVFVAESLPRFGKVLNFVGGSTTTLTTSIFPCYFYLKLCAMSSDNPQWPQRRISLPEKIYLYLIMILGVIGGAISTYSAVTEIVKPSSFNPPCYVDLKAASQQ